MTAVAAAGAPAAGPADAALGVRPKEYVEVEAYEEAAKIRDHIRSLEHRLTDNDPLESGNPPEGQQ